MKLLPEAAPCLLVIQIQIQAVWFWIKAVFIANMKKCRRKHLHQGASKVKSKFYVEKTNKYSTGIFEKKVLSGCPMVARPINTATSLSLVCPYSMFCFADQCLSSQPNFQLRVMYQRVCLSYERRWFLGIIKSV